MNHPTELDLEAYAADPSTVQDSSAISAHIRECAACREYVEDAREFLDFARDPAVRAEGEAMCGRPRRLDEALAARATIEAENLQAARRLAPLLKTPLRFLDAEVASDP